MAVTKKRGQFVQTEVILKNTGDMPLENTELHFGYHPYYPKENAVGSVAYSLYQPIPSISPGETYTQRFGKLIEDNWPLAYYNTNVTWRRAGEYVLDSLIMTMDFEVVA